MLNEFIKKNIFKFQYDNTLSKQSSEEKISTNRFKFQYDNTLRISLSKSSCFISSFKFQYDNTLSINPMLNVEKPKNLNSNMIIL